VEKSEDIALRRVNLGLVVAIVSINLYVFIAPFTPQIGLWRRQQQAKSTAGLPYQTKLSKSGAERAAIPDDDRLVIPKLALNEHIYTGTASYLVNKGVWARPKTSTPPQGSNTVLVGHRFTYHGRATFYSLDKLARGDNIVIYWQHKEYDYQVEEIKVVPATALEIEAPTKDAQLTLYTCTPIWSGKDRLVIMAKQIGAN